MGDPRRRQRALERHRMKRKAKRAAGRRPAAPSAAAALFRRAGIWPLLECLINPDWRETNLARIVLARNRPGGGVAVGAFLVDTGCLGVKVAFGNPFLTEEDYRGRLLSQMSASGQMVPCDPALAAKIVREGVAYAADLGFDPDPDFHDVRWLFGEIDADASSEVIPLGRDGKPFYVAGPDDDARAVLARLRSRLGEDGFHFIAPADAF